VRACPSLLIGHDLKIPDEVMTNPLENAWLLLLFQTQPDALCCCFSNVTRVLHIFVQPVVIGFSRNPKDHKTLPIAKSGTWY